MHPSQWAERDAQQQANWKWQGKGEGKGNVDKAAWKQKIGQATNKFLLASAGLADYQLQEEDNWEAPANQIEQEEACPMILSHINNPTNPRYNNLAILRIRNAASELMQCHYDLGDYLVEVEHELKLFCLQMAQSCETIMERMNRQMQHKVEQKGEDSNAKEALIEAEQMVNKLAAENEALQERIFDLEQRIVGVELEVDRRLKERGRKAEKQAAAAAREESREIITRLQQEVATLKEKCLRLESHTHPSAFRQRQYQLKELEAQLSNQKEELRKEWTQIQRQKEATYQREHELISGEENLTRKVAQLRKKESELSEWETELTRKSRKVQGVRQLTVQSQLAEDLSRDELNRSGQVSLKSFGRRPKEEQLLIAPTSLEQLGIHRKRTLNNEQQPQSPRDPLQIVRERRQARMIAENNYARKEGGEGRRFNLQLSSYQASREASPYRALQDLKSRGGNQHSHHYVLPKNSPRQPRELSKNSRSSVSRSRPARPGGEEGGLGSKLERLREEIKKQIESIK